MTGTNTTTHPTLLPYLNGAGTGLRLVLPALMPDQAKAPVRGVLESSGPFAVVCEGRVSGGQGGAMADLFLLVQPDRYPVPGAELLPINNVMVEQLWQAAFKRIEIRRPGQCQPVFEEQVDAERRLRAFRPLFRCDYRNRWCQPRCPGCGRDLTVCREDRLLQDAGLGDYSNSLERYLYCPACAGESPDFPFYAPDRQASAPERLKDCAALIEGFSRLLSHNELAGDLPCVGCVEAVHCYGPETLVHQRMRPVFFYPFFMLMMPAATINLLEFTALLSGERRESIAQRLGRTGKPGRMAAFRKIDDALPDSWGLLFPEDGRRFLEVLFLKLNLLGDMIRLLPEEEAGVADPVGRMSLEAIWVDLPVKNARLPWSWNFSLCLIDPVGQVDHGLSKSTRIVNRRLHFLGAAWGYVLLTGAGQSMEAVWAAIEKLVGHPEVLAPGEEIDPAAIDPALDARHLLNDGAALRIEPAWRTFWQRAVLMGGELFRASNEPEPAWQETSFLQALEALCSDIRQVLFQPAGAVSGVAEERRQSAQVDADTDATANNDAAIADILNQVLKHWPEAKPPSGEEETLVRQSPGIEPAASEPSSANSDSSNEDGDFVETVILGSSGEPETLPEGTQSAPPDLEETVVIAPDEKPVSPVRKEEIHWEADLEQTVVISRTEKIDPSTEDLEETVLIGSASSDERAKGRTERSKPGDQSSSEDLDLEKTVVIQPERSRERKPKS
ncbi:hypothetical protein [Desulfatitalea tepidiphila]|uniref:hypothetical protein n=1 Tax=Desulfatitalea tepidiphila TaxID=1185843 RepID=UPI00128EECE8|nr:hypothetical protein [Desulfatitalea tepidiphila]